MGFGLSHSGAALLLKRIVTLLISVTKPPFYN
jgi:hypothetical protein